MPLLTPEEMEYRDDPYYRADPEVLWTCYLAEGATHAIES